MLERAADPRMVAGARAIARGACLAVSAAALTVLAGWTFDRPELQGYFGGHVAMNPVTAIAFCLAAASLWVSCGIEAGPVWRSRAAAQGLAILVSLIGLQRAVAYLIGFPYPLDRLLFAARLHGNEMAPNTSGAFVLMGLALATLDVEAGRRRARPAVWLALLPGCAGLLALAGYSYGVMPLIGFRRFIEMATATGAAFVVLAAGVLCARPLKEPVATLVSRTDGGATARRLLPVAVLAPLFLGWLRLQGEQKGWYTTQFGVALFAVVLVGVFVGMVYLSGRSLARAEMRRRATEDMLSVSEAFYHTLVESLPQNIFRKDLQGRFTFANGRFLAEVGITIDRLKGRTDFDFFPHALAERYRRDDQNVIRTGQPFDTVEEHVKPGGEKIYVQVLKTAVYDDRGRVIGTQGMFWDVTEKRRSEQLLQEKNRQLEEAARAEREAREALIQTQGQLVQSEKMAGLGQMVAGVAHEINNPLSFVGNNVVVIQRDVAALRKLIDLYRQADGSVPADLRAQIADFEQQIDVRYTLENLDSLFARSREGLRRIQQIVKDLRDFARLDESELEEVNLNAGIESTLNIVQGHAKRKHVRLTTDLGPLPPVLCYPAKVNQVVMNLVCNAIDASPDNGEVTVRTRAQTPDDEIPDDPHVLIEVQDRGHGVPDAIKQKIFDPFFTTKPIGEGTGLGLSISYGIVRDHGGTITLTSDPGQGTTFKVRLPTRCATAKSKP